MCIIVHYQWRSVHVETLSMLRVERLLIYQPNWTVHSNLYNVQYFGTILVQLTQNKIDQSVRGVNKHYVLILQNSLVWPKYSIITHIDNLCVTQGSANMLCANDVSFLCIHAYKLKQIKILTLKFSATGCFYLFLII